MIEQPLVSIITVVFNGEQYLQQTIDSVRDQTYKNIEYILIDGGSTDRTIDIIKSNKAHIAHWVSEPDDGLYDAMNKGIKQASGELIGIINSDDWYELDAVETVVNTYLQDKSKTIFHADRYDVYTDGTKKIFKFNPSILKFKYLSMTYNHPSMFIVSEVYKQYTYNTKLKVYSDYQFTLTSYLKNRNQFVYIEKPTVNFRLGGLSGQIPLSKILAESFRARRNAGMGMVECYFAGCCKIVIETVKFVLNKRQKF